VVVVLSLGLHIIAPDALPVVQFCLFFLLLLGLRFFGFFLFWLTCSFTAFAIPIAFKVPLSLLFSLIAFVNSDLNFFHVFSIRVSFFHALMSDLRSRCSSNWFNPCLIRVESSMVSFNDSREFLC
jgi:hypothetical protein